MSFIDPDRGDWRQQEESEQREWEQEMGLKVNQGGGDFELPEAGVYVARCYRVIDLGTQKSEYMGKPTFRRKVIISFELLSGTRMEDGRPFTIHSTYSASLNDRAVLRKDLESWRGRRFTPEELEGFDLAKIIGHPCMVNIVHSDDGQYANVKAIMPLPGGTVAPKMENEPVDFSLEDFKREVYDKLGDKLKEKIALSPEYAAAVGAGAPVGGVGEMDEDIPFR